MGAWLLVNKWKIIAVAAAGFALAAAEMHGAVTSDARHVWLAAEAEAKAAALKTGE